MQDQRQREAPSSDEPRSSRDEGATRIGSRVSAHVESFCAQTSIHGLKYIGERRRHWLERFVWGVAVSVALCFACLLIARAWQRWAERPVIVSLDERLRSVAQLPFPAVTICPETRLRKDVFNYTDAHAAWRNGTVTRPQFQALSTTSLLCDAHLFQGGPKYVGPATIDFLEKLSLGLEDTVLAVKWQGTLRDTKVFQPLWTEEGLCYSFNMMHHRDLFSPRTFHGSGRYLAYENVNNSQDDGTWPSDGEGDDVGPWEVEGPRRAKGAGALLGLSVVLRAKAKDIDFLCKGPAQGFKIHLHSPAEFPRMSQQYFRAQLDHDLVVAVTPQVMVTSAALRSYSPSVRQCLFQGERPLSFFKVYSQQNCAVECLANATRQRCGCYAFHMPRDANATVCGTGSAECVQEARDALVRGQAGSGGDGGGGGGGGSQAPCGCLMPCLSLAFGSERSHAQYDWSRMLHAMGESPHHYEGYHMARVHIFFRDEYFIASRRSELYGITDFIASCGGLLGLGMGVSVLSLVELLLWLLCPQRR